MLSLPRGGFRGASNVPLSSAEWEEPQAVERLAYGGGAALFVGAIPYAENWLKLKDFGGKVGAALKKMEEASLESIWRAAQLLAICMDSLSRNPSFLGPS